MRHSNSIFFDNKTLECRKLQIIKYLNKKFILGSIRIAFIIFNNKTASITIYG